MCSLMFSVLFYIISFFCWENFQYLMKYKMFLILLNIISVDWFRQYINDTLIEMNCSVAASSSVNIQDFYLASSPPSESFMLVSIVYTWLYRRDVISFIYICNFSLHFLFKMKLWSTQATKNVDIWGYKTFLYKAESLCFFQ